MGNSQSLYKDHPLYCVFKSPSSRQLHTLLGVEPSLLYILDSFTLYYEEERGRKKNHVKFLAVEDGEFRALPWEEVWIRKLGTLVLREGLVIGGGGYSMHEEDPVSSCYRLVYIGGREMARKREKVHGRFRGVRPRGPQVSMAMAKTPRDPLVSERGGDTAEA